MDDLPVPAPGEEGERILTSLLRGLDDLGLYSSPSQMQAFVAPGSTPDHPDWASLIADGGQVIVRLQCEIGQVAWTERVLNPVAAEERKTFELTAPTEDELWLEALKEGVNLDLENRDENQD